MRDVAAAVTSFETMMMGYELCWYCRNNNLSRRGCGNSDPVHIAEEPRGRGKHDRGVVVRGQLGGVSLHVRWEERQTVTAATLLQMEQTRLN